MKKFLLVLAAALVLSVSAFADNEVYFANPLEFTNANGVATLSSDGDVYFCALTYSYNYSFSSVIAFSTTQNASYTLVDSGQTYNQTCSNAAGNGVFYNWPIINRDGSTFDPAITRFPSNYNVSMMADEFLNFIANQPVSPGVLSSFTVPCGNVLYFKVDREQDVTFTAVMPVLSSLLGTPTGAWNSGIQYGPAAALPTSGTTFPILSQDPINFAKTVSNQNLLGQTKNAISTKRCIAGQYYALYLPYHYGGWLALGSSHVYPDGSTSGGIVGANVTVSGSFAEIKVYPLTEKANGDLLTGSVTLDSGSDDGFASYFDGEISDTGTVTWLDQNGDISFPSVGGTSYVPEDVSTESIIDQIKNILSSIVSEIKNLFSFGYEAVNTLVGLMRDFVGVFQQLYEWLPSEVYSALISAIIVAITIGVFKVFL